MAGGNPNKNKGDIFERAILEYLRTWFPRASRDDLTGQPVDMGDIYGVRDSYGRLITLQLKNYRNLATAVREGTEGAAKQAEAADNGLYAAIIKKPRDTAPSNQYVVMPLAAFVTLIHKPTTNKGKENDQQ